MKHSLLSPSGADKWLNCPPSVRLEQRYPKTTSEDARIGTFAHYLAEIKFTSFLEKIPSANSYKNHELYSEELEDHINAAVDYVIEEHQDCLKNDKYTDVFLEKKYYLNSVLKNGKGIVDVCMVNSNVLKIIDYKFGFNTVDAYKNPQLSLYALGAIFDLAWQYDFDTIELHIVQPRAYNFSVWKTSKKELKEWAESIKPNIKAAYLGAGDLTPGSWCKYCRAAIGCEKYKTYFNQMLQEVEQQKELEKKELISIYEKAQLVTDWLEKVKSKVEEMALKGEKVEGHKLVHGKSYSRWPENTKNLIDLLKSKGLKTEDIFNTKLKAINEIKKKVGDNYFQEHIAENVVKSQGKLKLVPNSDKRKEVKISSAEEDFDL